MPNKFKGTVKTTINAEYKSTVNCCLANVSPLYLANKFENGDFALAIIGSFIIGFISVIFSYKYTENKFTISYFQSCKFNKQGIIL